MSDELDVTKIWPHSVTFKTTAKDGRAYWDIKIRSQDGFEDRLAIRTKDIHEQYLKEFPHNVYPEGK